MLACRASIHKPDTNPARFPFSLIPVQLNPCSAQSLFSSIPVQLNLRSAQSPFSSISVQLNPRSFFRLTVLFCKAFLAHLAQHAPFCHQHNLPLSLVPDLIIQPSRAHGLSNLVAIHEKTGIGTLSAYCGAVSAGAGAGAGIAYLCGGDYQAVIHTVVNALAITSGIVCDGAKASCAAKIAFSVDAGILGFHMYQNGQEFKSGDGIVMKDIESTIRGIGMLGKDGMRETNNEIIRLMVGEEKC